MLQHVGLDCTVYLKLLNSGFSRLFAIGAQICRFFLKNGHLLLQLALRGFRIAALGEFQLLLLGENHFVFFSRLQYLLSPVWLTWVA